MNFFDDPFLYRIEIWIKGDTCVLLGVEGLQQGSKFTLCLWPIVIEIIKTLATKNEKLCTNLIIIR